MNAVTIEVFVEKNCSSCETVVDVVRQVPELLSSKVVIRNREQDPAKFRERRVMIVPATFINNALVFYGTFTKEDLQKYLKKYTSK
ncbi:MAG: thioredoxin family protein [Bacteroidota bacterium]|nr:thioredoxin family protein [Bacteroidota bacterium]